MKVLISLTGACFLLGVILFRYDVRHRVLLLGCALFLCLLCVAALCSRWLNLRQVLAITALGAALPAGLGWLLIATNPPPASVNNSYGAVGLSR
jgi:hypothetical protein